MNSNPNPRQGGIFRQLMESVRRNKVKVKKRNYEDRGNLQLRQGVLSDDEKSRIQSHCMKGGWKGIRNYFGVCNMRAMALRGENIRKLELPDLFLWEMTAEGSNCNAIVSVLNEGKTNQFGKIEVSG